jgi:hypothetical protein
MIAPIISDSPQLGMHLTRPVGGRVKVNLRRPLRALLRSTVNHEEEEEEKQDSEFGNKKIPYDAGP